MKKEIKILMDEKRNLYIKDEDGKEYNFYVLGYGVPASFIIETKEEQDKRIK